MSDPTIPPSPAPLPLFPRLLRYANKPAASQNENFTTEALAGCIDREPGIFVDWLRKQGIGAALGPIAAVSTQTQVVLSDGRPDLVVELRGEGGSRQLWFEIKLWAAETNGQLGRYVGAGQARSRTVEVVLLSPQDLDGRPQGTRFLCWQSLYDFIRAQAGGPSLWQEFNRLLEITAVADPCNDPISAQEARGLEGAHALFCKTARICELLFARLAETHAAPGLKWERDPRQLRQMMATEFMLHRRYTARCQGRWNPAVVVGITPDLSDRPRLVLFVEMKPGVRYDEPRDRLLAAARTMNRPDRGWVLHDGSQWVLLERSEPLAALVEQRLDAHQAAERLHGWMQELGPPGEVWRTMCAQWEGVEAQEPEEAYVDP